MLINAPSDKPYYISVQPPLGLLYIAAYLRQNGLQVEVLDLNVEKRWLAHLKRALEEYNPSFIGLTSNFSNQFTTCKIATHVKSLKKNILIFAGGPHPTIAPAAYCQSGIDYIIPFEAESKTLEFILSAEKHKLKGVINCNAGQGIDPLDERHRELTANLDALPFPAYDLIDIRKYYINSFKRRPIVSLITSRGCPSRCIFCSQAVFGRIWRPRSAANVVEEMIWLKDRIGAREISIEDDNFTFDLGRASEICQLMRSRGVNMPWQLANGIRADRATKELLREMKVSGCWKIAIAPEVGDEESLARIGKGIALERFRQVARWCRELKVVYYGFFLMGFPFQSKENMENTIRFAIKLDPLLMDLSKVVPFEGTTMYKEFPALKNLYLKKATSFYCRSGDLLLDRMYRKAYLKFYLRFNKILDIIRTIGMRQFYRLVQYAWQVIF